MTYKSYFLTLALLLCTTIARAQYNQVNDIPYRDAAKGYAVPGLQNPEGPYQATD